MQNTQMLKREINTILDSLPEDGINLLAEFVGFLRSKYATQKSGEQNAESHEPEVINLATTAEAQHRPARIYSPRLVNPAQVSDFDLEETED